jgi:AcrR family transcriptional regulator
MRLRKEEPYEQRRQQIIDGALEVFASKGFEKATNKDIAHAAGIGSAGLIYHYFEDKADLFRQVIEQRAPALQLVAHPEHVMELPPREGLLTIAHTFLKIVDDPKALAVIKLMVGEVAHHPDVATMINRIGPGRVFPVLAAYLERQMQAGYLRQVDTSIAVRCFIGPLLAYIITREVFPQPDSATLSTERMAESLVDLFLHGMATAYREGETEDEHG